MSESATNKEDKLSKLESMVGQLLQVVEKQNDDLVDLKNVRDELKATQEELSETKKVTERVAQDLSNKPSSHTGRSSLTPRQAEVTLHKLRESGITAADALIWLEDNGWPFKNRMGK